MFATRVAILAIFFCASVSHRSPQQVNWTYGLGFFQVSSAPVPGELSQESRAIALIHHLTYLIDYLVHYVLGNRDRKTPPEAVDYYQAALVEGRNPQSSDAETRHYKPSAARARQEMEALDKMMKS
ncbi:uncharacterized protein LOC128267184 [Anopheles cruzii]|uniref:uncharacterized protein LOC128267184 n=1 Tax=Anopheles cruzii TaxID=68878 RepID=UPI0022EC3FCB|nr:uncharacterized protein LOC128267184 [Anopheles cruzii]